MKPSPCRFVVQTPKAIVDKGKLALIFGLLFSIPVLVFSAIFSAWESTGKVLVSGTLLTGTGIVILLTHRNPRLEVYGTRLRVVGPGKQDRAFSIEDVGRTLRSPSGGRVLLDHRGQVLLRLPPGMENLNLLDQYLFGKD